jgi:hypothetical protein
MKNSINLEHWTGTRTGVTVFVDGRKVGHVTKSAAGGYFIKLTRQIGKAEWSRVYGFAKKLCPGRGGMAVGVPTACLAT